jgi:hypothetical protein
MGEGVGAVEVDGVFTCVASTAVIYAQLNSSVEHGVHHTQNWLLLS